MARRKSHPKLTPRQGKCLRFIVSRCTEHDWPRQKSGPIQPRELVIKQGWTDLPHTLLQAISTCQQLETHGMVVREDKLFAATDDGVALMKVANAKHWWTTTESKEQ